MNWLYYLLEANLYLAVFYAFYRMFLHQETFYSLNRYYLITATILSFILPVLQIGYLNNIFFGNQESTMVMANVVYQKRAAPAASSPLDLSSLLYGAYVAIAMGFMVKMLFTLSQIFRIYFQSKRRKIDKVTLIELQGEHAAFSFFNILFINPNLDQKETILKHEMVHIKQHHSADVLFFEIVQVISWFNPILYFLKRDIKLLHEYLADEQTTATGIEKHEYALFLIQHSFGTISNALSNQIFNESLLKRRIKMLNKQKSGALAKFRLFLLVPVATCLLCVSTMAFTKDYAVVDLYPEKTTIGFQDPTRNRSVVLTPRGSTIFKPNTTYDKDSKLIKSNEKRLIVINGRIVVNNNNFNYVADYSELKELSPAEAMKKYGAQGKYGAVELSGSNIAVTQSLANGYHPAGTPKGTMAPPPMYTKSPVDGATKSTAIRFPLPKKKAVTIKSSAIKTQTTASQASVSAPKAITITPIKTVTIMPQQSAAVKGMTAMRSPRSNLTTAFGAKPAVVNDNRTVSSVTFIRRADGAVQNQETATALAAVNPQITRINIGTAGPVYTFHTAGPEEMKEIMAAKDKAATAATIKEIEKTMADQAAASSKTNPATKYHDSIKTIAVQQ